MLLYWLLSKTIDVYQITILGVLYEIIWLPMLVLFIVLPILNTYSLIKNKKKGTVILYPAFLPHRVTEIIKGSRYVIVGHLNGPEFR